MYGVPMKRSELVAVLNTLPDVEVVTYDGGLVTGAIADAYDDDSGNTNVPCIVLEEGDE
jgi:hypothetical protein